jgi:hypothetical protein
VHHNPSRTYILILGRRVLDDIATVHLPAVPVLTLRRKLYRRIGSGWRIFNPFTNGDAIDEHERNINKLR